MMSEEIIMPLQDCNVHVALMGSEFDVQGDVLSLLCLTATQVIANKATLEWIIFVLFGFVFWLSVHSSKFKLVDTVQWINCFTSQYRYVIAKYWAGMHAFEWQIPLMEN